MWLASVLLLTRAAWAQELHGSGAVLYAPYVRHVADDLMTFSRRPLRVTYRATDPLGAIKDFTNATGYPNAVQTDFMAAGKPLAADAYQTLQSSGRNPLHFIIGYRTVAVYANFPGLLNSGVYPNMTGCDFARIVLGQVQSWNDPNLTSINNVRLAYPSVFADVSIKVAIIHRPFHLFSPRTTCPYLEFGLLLLTISFDIPMPLSHSQVVDQNGNHSTAITIVAQKGALVADLTVTQYLSRACPQLWTFGVMETAAVAFADGFKVIEVNSLSEIAQAVWDTPFSIAWSALEPSLSRGLTIFALETPSGEFAIPNDDSARDALQIAFEEGSWRPVDGDWSTMDIVFSNQGRLVAAWPMSEAVFLITQSPTNTTAHDALLKAYLTMFYEFNNQDTIANDLSFGPLVPAMVTYLLGELNRVLPDAALGANAFYFEDATPTTATHDSVNSISDLRTPDWMDQLDGASAALDDLDTALFNALPITLDGSGSALVGLYIGQVMTLLRDRSKVPINMGFRAIGTDSGLAELMGDANDNFKPYVEFGVGESVLTTANYQILQSRGIQVMQIPLVFSTLGFYHSVPGFDDSTGPMNISACLLAAIYSRKITTWNDNRVSTARDAR